MNTRHFSSTLAALLAGLLVPAFSAEADGLSVEEKRELLAKADRWEVPQPAKGSKPVKLWAFGSGDKDMFALGFVDSGNPKRVLVGFDYWDTEGSVKTEEVPDLASLSLRDIASRSPFSEVNGVNFGLVTGLQLLRDGWEKKGGELIEKSLKEDAGRAHSSFYSPANEPASVMLARSCLAAALNEITSERPDFPRILNRIRRLTEDQPEVSGEHVDGVLKRLEASVAHVSAPAGSIERIIDDYLMGGGTAGGLGQAIGEISPTEKALVLRGFEAVPFLLKQRHSLCFTNHLMQGFNNFVSFPMTAGQVIDDYLVGFANDEFESNWLERIKGGLAEDEAILGWWKSASAMGEEAYVRKYTVRKGKKRSASVSDELLLIAGARYPALLPELYRKVMKTEAQSWPMAQVLADSNGISKEAKIALFKAAVATNRDAHRNTAVRHLRDLEPALADEATIRLLKKAPDSPKVEYWRDQDAALGGLVSDTSEPAVWAAFHVLLARADLGMRMELISDLRPLENAPETVLESFHRIYERYRDDPTVRDETGSEKYDGPGAGFPHERIAVRDFIHTHWADWLHLEIEEPEEGATEAEWRRYREKVASAIASARKAVK